jgi:nucleotide-binding universal stress UspA family protein
VNRLPTTILLATDGSHDAALAATAAAGLSNATGSELHLVHVLQQFPRYAYPGVTPELYSMARDEQDRQGRELLAEEAKRVREGGGNVAEVHLRRGRVADEILGLAESLGAGLIALGSRGLGPVKRLVMGSVSEGVVHGAPCPVLVLRGGADTWPPKRIVIGDDGSRAAEDAGELAASIAKLFGATVLLIRVYPRLPEIDAAGRGFDARMVDDELHREEQVLGDRAGEIERLLGVRPRIRIGVGDPADELLEAAGEGEEERALVAVGSRGLDAMQRVRLGSVSTKILHAARGPVLVHPPPENRDGRDRGPSGTIDTHGDA